MYTNNNVEFEDTNIAELFSQISADRRAPDDEDIPAYRTEPIITDSMESDRPKVLELSPELALPRIRSYLDVGSTVRLTVTGNSMQPFLSDRRDSVILAPVKRKLKTGDIIFYLRSENQPILHRIIDVPSAKNYICCGDAQNTPEKVTREQVIAVVSDVEHRGSYTSCASVSWRLKSMIWMRLMPLRPRLLRLILMTRHFLNK